MHTIHHVAQFWKVFSDSMANAWLIDVGEELYRKAISFIKPTSVISNDEQAFEQRMVECPVKTSLYIYVHAPAL